jgi:hypothetical protein
MNGRRRLRILGILLLLPAVSLLFWITAMLASNLPGTVAFAVNVHGLNTNTYGVGTTQRPAPLSLSVLDDARGDEPSSGASASSSPAPGVAPSPTPKPSPATTPRATASPTPAPTLGPTPSLIPLPTPTLPTPTPTPTPGSGTISGQVVDSQTHNPIVAATVSLSPSGATTLTDTNGNFSLTVAAGTYTVTASAATYNSASQTVTVNGGQRQTVSFKLTSITAYGDIAGTVVDSLTQAPIVGATVSLSNGLVRVTDLNGNFSYTIVLNGSYTLTVSALGYVTQSQPVTVKAGKTTTVRISLAR